MKHIPITKPTIGQEEVDAVTKVLSSGYLVRGKKVREAEVLLAKKFNRKYVLNLTSGTASLNTVATLLDLGKDDEVITTPFTFIATANAINYVGAKVVFADIDSDTFNIDPNEVEKKVNKKTKAIIAVDLFGYPFEYEKINKIARKYNLFLIEDAAQAHGAFYGDKPAGSLGDISILSFYGSKVITSGEGGAILTNNKKWYEKASAYISHGQSKNRMYSFLSLGYNFLPTDIQAAILLEQIKKLDKFVKLRNKVADYYTKKLKKVEGIVLPRVDKKNTHAFSLYTIRVKPPFAKRNSLLRKLNDNGVGARVYYPTPLHLQPVWRKLGYKFKKGDYPEAENAAREVLSLPIYPLISESELEYVVNTFLNCGH